MTLGDVGETQTPSAKTPVGVSGRVTKTRVCLSHAHLLHPSLFIRGPLPTNLFISSSQERGGALFSTCPTDGKVEAFM